MSKDYLLDTHVWLWSLLEPERLRKKTRALLSAPGSTLWLSPVSIWETTVLVEDRKLELDADPRRWIQDAIAASGIGEAPLNHEVALQSRELKLKHDDAADRFIAATASVYQFILVTADERLLRGKGYDTMRA
ncbi:MAG: type II toxin-antitoxin system VapC family toxin [Myxococcales bacterium]|nr:type II toxin-antitoxin system VapC family toxin [Myxococcales bacterium]